MRGALLIGLAVALSAAPAAAQEPRIAISRHVALIREHSVPYTARVAESVVRDPSGRPAAAVVTIAYLRSDVRDPAKRPVMFLFNGGPGASSSPLHMDASGPVLRIEGTAGDRSGGTLANNPDSPLDDVDLVFIDPVSTGFSRPLPGADPQPFYDSIGDANEIADVIEDWLKTNHRERSPRFLAGESYGTTRAPLIVKVRPGLRWNGVLLISGGGGLVGPNMAAADRIPAMAAAAWYHDAVDRRGSSIAQFYAEAGAFAHGPYLDALNKGAALRPEERRRTAATLSGFIGLPAAELEANDLQVKGDFTMQLLKARGLRIGRLDTRVTAPLPKQAAKSAIDDPSLHVVQAGAEANATPESIGAVPSPAVGRYLTSQLRFPSTDTYIGVNFAANAKWKWHPEAGRPAEIMADAMRADPKLRLFAVNGYFDLGGTDGAGFRQAGVPADRLYAVELAGPHQVYDGDGARAVFNDDVRRFVNGK